MNGTKLIKLISLLFTAYICLYAICGNTTDEYIKIIPLYRDALNSKYYFFGSDKIANGQSVERSSLDNIAKRFEERKKRVRTMCKEYNNPMFSVQWTLNLFTYFSKKYDILNCLIAKAGCSTWIKHLLSMEGYNFNLTDYEYLHKPPWKSRVLARTRLSSDELKHKAESVNTTMIMTTRHPLSRLVSAYRNKFFDGKTLTMEELKVNVDYGYFWVPVLQSLKIKPNTTEMHLSFDNFIKYVLKNAKGPNWNDHWSQMIWTCSPCNLNYDYILNLETLNEDLIYIKHALNITEMDLSVRMNQNTNEDTSTTVRDPYALDASTLKYYSQISDEALYKLYQLYKIDLEVFDYSFPQELMKRIQIYEDMNIKNM